MAGANIATTLTAFSGGASAVATQPSQWIETFTGTWAVGDTISTILTNALTGDQVAIGFGAVTGKQPTFVFIYKDKVYALIGDTAYMTAIGEPTVWNDPNATGNGSVQMSNFNGSPMQLVSVANYQGRLVFMSRDTILIWNVDPDPTQWSLVQTLGNIGTVAKDSVKALGDLDVFFLADSGVRSVRVRDSSLNAFVSDIGSPIDQILTGVMQGTSPNTSGACSVVEPSANRYWLFLKDTIYVLSYFPSNKILAWSTYDPTYNANGTQTVFTPYRMCIFGGQVYLRGTDGAIYQHGGSDNNTYDNVVATVQTPFHDIKAPMTRKGDVGVHASVSASGGATWSIGVAFSDITSPGMPEFQAAIANVVAATFDGGKNGVPGWGTHVAFQAQTSGSGPATLSELCLTYQGGDTR